METINVRGLPDPIVRAIETFVAALRRQLEPGGRKPGRIDLPHWPGIAVPIEQLRRVEVYRNVG